MANPLEQAIKSGLKANEEIGKSFARMGVGEHPRGFVVVAYRNANRALKQALAEPNRVQAAHEVMDGLRSTLTADFHTELNDMGQFGQEEAARQLRYYGVQAAPGYSMSVSASVSASVTALMARVNAQDAALSALLLSGASEAEILGNEEHAGAVRPGEILAGAAYWAAMLVWAGFAWLTEQHGAGGKYKKQAVAALDERTTECCLKVNGQVQPLKGKFVLTGEPRFDDRMDWPAFHWYCRTSVVLYDEAFDMGLTAQMQAASDKILRERAAGGSGYRHPAHARS